MPHTQAPMTETQKRAAWERARIAAQAPARQRVPRSEYAANVSLDFTADDLDIVRDIRTHGCARIAHGW